MSVRAGRTERKASRPKLRWRALAGDGQLVTLAEETLTSLLLPMLSWWMKMSSPPVSGARKPKPFLRSNHLMMPVCCGLAASSPMLSGFLRRRAWRA